MIESGLSECRLVVGEDLGAQSEKVRSFSPSDAAAADFSPLNVILVLPADPGAGPETRDEPEWIFGFGEEAFEREAGMITKMEVRAVALASLQLGPGRSSGTSGPPRARYPSKPGGLRGSIGFSRSKETNPGTPSCSKTSTNSALAG